MTMKMFAENILRKLNRASKPSLLYSGLRKYSQSASFGKEIRIPVPWGFLAAKEWGRQGAFPVLGFHGIDDNCSTFDRLGPLLASDHHFVAYDFPGYGLSPPIPNGFYPNIITYMSDIKRVLNHLGWSKCAIIGHSMGGAAALYYAAISPDDVTHLVGLDPAKPISGLSEDAPELMHGAVEQIMAIEAVMGGQPKTHSLDEALQTIITRSRNSLTEESARILMKRSCTLVDPERNLVRFNYDIKNRFLPFPMLCAEQTRAYAEALGSKGTTLIVHVDNGSIPDWAVEMDAFSLKDFVAICRRNPERFQVIQLEGTHHVHLNNPERLLPIVTQFFKTSKIELQTLPDEYKSMVMYI